VSRKGAAFGEAAQRRERLKFDTLRRVRQEQAEREAKRLQDQWERHGTGMPPSLDHLFSGGE
jgi:hypothetical protein